MATHRWSYFRIKEAERSNLGKKKLKENTTRKEEGRRLHQEIIRNKKKLNNSQALDRVIIFTAWAIINPSTSCFFQLNTNSDSRKYWKPNNNRTNKEGKMFQSQWLTTDHWTFPLSDQAERETVAGGLNISHSTRRSWTTARWAEQPNCYFCLTFNIADLNLTFKPFWKPPSHGFL